MTARLLTRFAHSDEKIGGASAALFLCGIALIRGETRQGDALFPWSFPLSPYDGIVSGVFCLQAQQARLKPVLIKKEFMY